MVMSDICMTFLEPNMTRSLLSLPFTSIHSLILYLVIFPIVSFLSYPPCHFLHLDIFLYSFPCSLSFPFSFIFPFFFSFHIYLSLFSFSFFFSFSFPKFHVIPLFPIYFFSFFIFSIFQVTHYILSRLSFIYYGGFTGW
jgi:hypothetical protein